MFFANQAIVGYQGGNYTGLRQDNQIQYKKKLGDFTIALGHTFGEQPGSTKQGSTNGATLGYDNGPVHLGGSYQVMNGITTGYFGVANPASVQKVWSLGGTYVLGAVKYYLGHTNSKLDVADYTNKAYYVGANVTLTPALSLIGTITYDKIKHAGADGGRTMAAAMLDYFLSKRTDIFTWERISTSSAAPDARWPTRLDLATPMFGNDSRVGVMMGIRHMFSETVS